MRPILQMVLISIALLIPVGGALADDSDSAARLQRQINEKYKNFFGPDSQSLLPFARLELKDWKALQSNQVLKRIYSEQDKFYNSKVYVFTLYQAPDGSYYLDAKGGFWGMDELIYGPISEGELQ